jgi:type II secretion system protein L
MAKTYLGLDIRSDHATAVLLSSSLKGYKITAQSRFDFSAPFPELQQEEVSKALKPILKLPEVTRSLCVLSLPPHRVSFRNLKAPFGERRKIRQMISFELEPMLIHPIETQVIDFYSTGSSTNGDLIAAAVHEEDLKKCLEALNDIGISVEIATAGGLGLATVLSRHTEDTGNFLIIDYDRDIATIFSVARKTIHLIRPCSLNLTGKDPLESVQTHIRQTLLLFEETFGFPLEPKQVLFSGNAVNRLSTVLPSEMAKIPVNLVDLSKDLNRLHIFGRDGNWISQEMDNALSLAVMASERIGILNFRQGDFSIRHKWAENRKPLISIAVMILVLLIMTLLNSYIGTRQLEKRFEALDQEITSIFTETFPEVKRIADPLQQMTVKVEHAKKDQLGAANQASRIKSIDILFRISGQIPDAIDVELSRLVIGDENVQLTGTTTTFNEVNDIKRHLEPLEFFQSVEISSANLERSGNRVQFKIVADLMTVPATRDATL